MSKGDGGEDPQRKRLRGALIEEVAQRGYLAASVEEAAGRAGLSRTALVGLGGLEECFAAIWEEIDFELAALMADAFGAEGEWPDRLRSSLLAGLRYLAIDQPRARFYVVEALYVNDEIRDGQRAAMGRFAELVDRGRADGNPERPPPHISDGVTGAIMHRVHHLVRTGAAETLPFELPQFMYFAVMPYRGVAAAEAELDRPLT